MSSPCRLIGRLPRECGYTRHFVILSVLATLDDGCDYNTEGPQPGWDNNIMAQRAAPVEERNIEEILKNYNLDKPTKGCRCHAK
jgi:hypothetical protein